MFTCYVTLVTLLTVFFELIVLHSVSLASSLHTTFKIPLSHARWSAVLPSYVDWSYNAYSLVLLESNICNELSVWLWIALHYFQLHVYQVCIQYRHNTSSTREKLLETISCMCCKPATGVTTILEVHSTSVWKVINMKYGNMPNFECRLQNVVVPCLSSWTLLHSLKDSLSAQGLLSL